ncbi:glycosyl transferase family 1 [Spirochaetia bacterium]|nr:glycosyl transferase family 1 [Spirochaetia bacterium]
MKILLVTRGSQGDIYPYIRLAVALKKQGHEITLSLPRLFEREAKDSGVYYVLQASDDIAGMLEGTPDTKNLLDWTRRVIDSQFKELIPMLSEHDMLLASNTEFAAPSIAEYCGKPYIRTAYGPFIPSRKIPPPVFPWSKPHPIFRPAFLWGLLNTGLNLMVKKTLNKNRKALGMSPIKDQAEHAPSNSDNYLLYSKYLGSTDSTWKYKWEIGGYCFNDIFPYDAAELEKLLAFIKKDERPTIFFTLGSCNVKQRDRFANLLFDVCIQHNYKLVVSCGWWEVGAHLQNRDNLFRLESPIPHCLIFPSCDAIIHHGGAGTTHSAARSGKPQLVVPLILDQFYWSHRVRELGIGPGSVNVKGKSKKQLEQKVVGLVTNPSYREKAASIGILIRGEGGLENICQYIENYPTQAAAEKKWA